MNASVYIPIFEAAISVLKENGKSEDLSSLFAKLADNPTLPAPSLLYDFFMEFMLTAHPVEEVGLGCYSVAHLERALREFKETGTTDLLEVAERNI